MPVCTPCLGLGVRHIQYLFFAFLVALEFWLQEFTVKSLLRTHPDVETSRSVGYYLNVTMEELNILKQAVIMSYAFGRLVSAFVCLKFNNKYLLIGFILLESTILVLTFWFVTNMNILVVGFSFSCISFTRAFHWTLVTNMLSKWMPPCEYTTANGLLVVTREMSSFILKFFIDATKSLEQSRALLMVLTSIYIIWAFAFLVFGAEGPDTSFLLSKIEHVQLAKLIGPRTKTRCSSKTPWKSIFGTVILYGWLIADFGRECCATVLSDGLTLELVEDTYRSVAGVQAGLCIAYLVIMGVCVISDKLIVKEVLTPGQVRKIYSSVGCCGTSISMILAAYSERTSPTFAFTIVGQVFTVIMATGQPISIFDISPNYAAVIFAMFTFLRNVLFVARLVGDNRLKLFPLTKHNFDQLFYRYGFLVFFTNLIFLLCGNIERKPFDMYDTHDWTKESIISYP